MCAYVWCAMDHLHTASAACLAGVELGGERLLWIAFGLLTAAVFVACGFLADRQRRFAREMAGISARLGLLERARHSPAASTVSRPPSPKAVLAELDARH